MNTNTKKELKNITLRKADRCVKCGLCSAQCPTYLLDGSENESPRGRVSLAQAIASNQIFEHQLVSHHIDSCLSCRRCEKICPSGVEVSQIVANTRNILNVEGHNSVRNLLVKLSARATYNDWKKISGLFHTLKRTGFFRLFPKLAPIREYINPALNINSRITDDQTAETIFLFAGCASQILDQATIKDSQELLGLCGYLVSIPDKQVCCGALPQHKGLLETAKQCESTNLRAFKREQIPVIFLATACGATLKAYEDDNFNYRTHNITTFLNEQGALDKFDFKPVNKRILIHEPCTEKNVLKTHGAVEKLLSHLPDAEIITLKETTGCCGAGGDYMISQPDIANKIRNPLVTEIKAINPDIIVTSNYTCGMHIQNGLLEKNLDIEVIHPIRLLLRYLIINT